MNRIRNPQAAIRNPEPTSSRSISRCPTARVWTPFSASARRRRLGLARPATGGVPTDLGPAGDVHDFVQLLHGLPRVIIAADVQRAAATGTTVQFGVVNLPFFDKKLIYRMHWSGLPVLRHSGYTSTRNTQYAIRNTQYAIRNTQHATRNTQYVRGAL
jgi:hypothetical protein